MLRVALSFDGRSNYASDGGNERANREPHGFSVNISGSKNQNAGGTVCCGAQNVNHSLLCAFRLTT